MVKGHRIIDQSIILTVILPVTVIIHSSSDFLQHVMQTSISCIRTFAHFCLLNDKISIQVFLCLFLYQIKLCVWSVWACILHEDCIYFCNIWILCCVACCTPQFVGTMLLVYSSKMNVIYVHLCYILFIKRHNLCYFFLLTVSKVYCSFLGIPILCVENLEENCSQNEKLSCHRETARRFLSWNILLSHSRSFETILLSRACESPY